MKNIVLDIVKKLESYDLYVKTSEENPEDVLFSAHWCKIICKDKEETKLKILEILEENL